MLCLALNEEKIVVSTAVYIVAYALSVCVWRMHVKMASSLIKTEVHCLDRTDCLLHIV